METNLSIDQFWSQCRATIPGLPDTPCEAWAFGATTEHADELLDLVLSGTKTATASSLWDYEHSGDPLPAVGDFSIILDGEGSPKALIETTLVEVVPFNKVSEAHAYGEGEDDRSLESWRDIHERFWRRFSDNSRGYEPDMPVICERFQLRYPQLSAGAE